jgi:hypothetical protein
VPAKVELAPAFGSLGPLVAGSRMYIWSDSHCSWAQLSRASLLGAADSTASGAGSSILPLQSTR